MTILEFNALYLIITDDYFVIYVAQKEKNTDKLNFFHSDHFFLTELGLSAPYKYGQEWKMIQLEIDQGEKYFLSNIGMLNPKIVTKCTPQVQPTDEKSW